MLRVIRTEFLLWYFFSFMSVFHIRFTSNKYSLICSIRYRPIMFEKFYLPQHRWNRGSIPAWFSSPTRHRTKFTASFPRTPLSLSLARHHSFPNLPLSKKTLTHSCPKIYRQTLFQRELCFLAS